MFPLATYLRRVNLRFDALGTHGQLRQNPPPRTASTCSPLLPEPNGDFAGDPQRYFCFEHNTHGLDSSATEAQYIGLASNEVLVDRIPRLRSCGFRAPQRRTATNLGPRPNAVPTEILSVVGMTPSPPCALSAAPNPSCMPFSSPPPLSAIERRPI